MLIRVLVLLTENLEIDLGENNMFQLKTAREEDFGGEYISGLFCSILL